MPSPPLPLTLIKMEAFLSNAEEQLKQAPRNGETLRAARQLLYSAAREISKELSGKDAEYDHVWVAEGHLTDALNSVRLYLQERR